MIGTTPSPKYSISRLHLGPYPAKHKPNFELEIKFFEACVKKKITLKNTIWVKKNEIQKIPISSLMRNILCYLNPI